MVIVVIKMDAKPEKILELKQTLQAMIEPTRKNSGCLSHYVYQDIENDNSLSLIQIWERQADLNRHLRSNLFSVLMGTRSLLKQAPEITLNEVSSTAGWEAVEAVRK